MPKPGTKYPRNMGNMKRPNLPPVSVVQGKETKPKVEKIFHTQTLFPKYKERDD